MLPGGDTGTGCVPSWAATTGWLWAWRAAQKMARFCRKNVSRTWRLSVLSTELTLPPPAGRSLEAFGVALIELEAFRLFFCKKKI